MANPITAASCCYYTLPALIATVVVGALGLTGQLNLWQVSTGCLVTSLFTQNLPAFIVSIMGLCGATTVSIVSGVSLGFAAVGLMVSCVCSSSVCLGGAVAAAAGQ